MGQAGKYILALLVVFGGFYAIKLVNSGKIIPLTEQATDPDLHFGNSRTYFKEKDFGRGMEHLIKAIKDIHNIERDLDPASNALLEESIKDLEIVQRELQHDSLVVEDINISYSEALNALTEAEVKVTKALLKSNHKHDAMIALKYGMTHLKNTLKYTEGDEKAKEKAIYSELDEVLNNTSLTDEEIMERLNHIIDELDSLHADNLHSENNE
ncbi:MAG: hypothetical protein GY816_08065 [Cytophagales bacterium]|nr:hypothetical protein [Cytophagales bacterium]